MHNFALHLRIRDHTTLFLEVSRDGLWTLSVGPHNSMVMALGLCVKWLLLLSGF
jgi:hypothetical protein